MYEYITLRRTLYGIRILCKVLKASESGYYRSLRAANVPRPWQLLLVKIRKIYEENPDNRNYGVGRILLALAQEGIETSRSSVRRAMKKGGLLRAPARRPQGLTKADAAAQKAENLIQRNFTAAAPNQKWLTDITQIPCADGKLYIVAVLDCCSGEIVGLAMDDNMKKEKLYQIQTEKMPMALGKSIVFRYIMVYYNRERIYTSTPGGLAPAMYRQAARSLAA